MKKRSLILLLSSVIVILEFLPISYTYNNDAATLYVKEHAENRSQGLCAKYVRKAIEAGGCPTYGHPKHACKYHSFLLKLGFEEYDDINAYHPVKGDIVVIDSYGSHESGHIAMFDGKRWYSDFPQKNMFGLRGKQPTKQQYCIYHKPDGKYYRRLSLLSRWMPAK